MNQAALINFIKELGQQLKRQVATSTMYDIPHVPRLKGTQHLFPCKETFFIFHFYFHIFFSCLFIFHIPFQILYIFLCHAFSSSIFSSMIAVHLLFMLSSSCLILDTKIQNFPLFVALLTKPLFWNQKSRTKNFLNDLE